MTFPWETPSTPANRISRQTRSDIFDWMSLTNIAWSGRLNDHEFLSRLYDLTTMPSFDSRYSDASGDIWQHTVNNDDEELDWVYRDPRFDLLGGPDEAFLRFLAETVNPTVRVRQLDAEQFVASYNSFLRPSGFEIYPERPFAERWIYGWREISPRRAPEQTRLAEHPEITNHEVFKQHLDRTGRDLESDPGMAIASSKNLLESLCKTILEATLGSYDDHVELPGLFRQTTESLGVNANSVPGDAAGSAALRKTMRSLEAVVDSIAEARNAIGDGHGATEVSPAEPRHARLTFNATIAVGEFLLDSWK